MRRPPRRAAPDGAAPAEPRTPTRDDLVQYAFRALAQRALTEQELGARLRRRGADDDLAEVVLSRLRELGYLNDAALARSATTRRGVGTMRVKQDLARRGVDRHTIEDALASRDLDAEAEDVRRLIDRYRARWERTRDPFARGYGFLARRGFRSDVALRALREADLRASDGSVGEEGEDDE